MTGFLRRRPAPRRAARPLLLLAALLALGASACRLQPERPQDVVLIVVDTLRADRLGRYGDTRGLTPVLDRLADRGTRFANAYAPTSWTMPSVASLLTSRLPSQHLVRDFDSRLAASELTLAERLTDAGFTNAGFTANWRLSESLGYAQGFPTWRPFLNSPGSEKKARAEVLRAGALAWLDSTLPGGGGKGPRLMYFQFMEPHVPFDPPAELRARIAPAVTVEQAAALNKWALMMSPHRKPLTPEEATQLALLYDAEVAAMDAELGRLFEALEQRGILQKALVIVTADHGEEFLEHGSFGHGYNLFNTTVHVPLLMAGPGVPTGRVVNDAVSLVDVAPTVLDLLGLAPEARFEGRSLVPLLRGETLPQGVSRDVVLQLPRNSFEWDLRAHRDGLVRGTQKLLVGTEGVGEVYNLATDPNEQKPQGPPASTALQAALDAANAALAARQQPEEQKAVVDEATKEKLRALGYHH